jgi:outer membrane protein OmpA-like peptidoglycan-associated protein
MNTTKTKTRKLRGLALATTLIAASGALAPAVAGTGEIAGPGPTARASKPETIGVGSGFALGALAAGPFGAVIGAATGSWLGDRYHRQAVAREESERRLERLRAAGANLGIQVMFRTDDAALQPGDADALERLAAVARGLPGAKLAVAGFTDPRGSALHNRELATRRAIGVVELLERSGIDPKAIAVEVPELASSAPDAGMAAAAASTGTDLDGYAFQRRVTVRITIDAPLAARRIDREDTSRHATDHF